MEEMYIYNFFFNYWLDVIFYKGDKYYVVLGYFVVDGNVGELLVIKGNKWCVYFVLDEIGEW